MEDLILSQFEQQNSSTGDMIMMRSLRNGIIQKLNPKQQDEVLKSIDSLINSGFITYENGKLECLRLTELGFQRLYKNSKSTDDIEELILNKFKQQNSRANDIVQLKNLNFTIFQQLNPIEKDLFSDAINNLQANGYVTYEGKNTAIECLRLTDIGYDKLY
ncbi:hypothetical protein OIU80_00910 [Flavobacterium sp. LS1R47]|uniref:Uncharacterized protein n=1 Tax=Flavobacterium frigoritolerans TaxID=2987686 RepID=A0A9X2YYC6_9FLAO|nr:hypothetical protein [Flavobacterium frigoritolerans]MCV9930829.1 hypothetical protein [Flavobacterium frigoritolerans]